MRRIARSRPPPPLRSPLPGAAAAEIVVKAVDTAEYPRVRVTAVTAEPTHGAARADRERRGRRRARGREPRAGQERRPRDRPLAVHEWGALEDAVAGARAFIRAKPGEDRIARHLLRARRGGADRLLDRHDRRRHRAPHAVGRRGVGNRAERRRRRGGAQDVARAVRLAGAHPAHRRPGDVQLGLARRGHRGRPRGRHRRLSDRDRELEVQPGAARAARRGHRRHVLRRRVDRRPARASTRRSRRSCAGPGSSSTSPRRGPARPSPSASRPAGDTARSSVKAPGVAPTSTVEKPSGAHPALGARGELGRDRGRRSRRLRASARRRLRPGVAARAHGSRPASPPTSA